jgi:hypothetical protein
VLFVFISDLTETQQTITRQPKNESGFNSQTNIGKSLIYENNSVKTTGKKRKRENNG